jgi:hypothetical protein
VVLLKAAKFSPSLAGERIAGHKEGKKSQSPKWKLFGSHKFDT